MKTICYMILVFFLFSCTEMENKQSPQKNQNTVNALIPDDIVIYHDFNFHDRIAGMLNDCDFVTFVMDMSIQEKVKTYCPDETGTALSMDSNLFKILLRMNDLSLYKEKMETGVI